MSNWLLILKPYFLTALASVLPVTELRASIPWAVAVFSANPWLLMVAAIVGNIVPAFILLWGLDYVDHRLLMKESFIRRIYERIIARTRRKTETKVLRYGYVALLIFVAIPLPGTGAWTGSIAAWVFGLEKKKSLLMICLGVVLAGIVVTLITTGVINFIKIS
jgi:uncharacterized membrane protein